MKKRIAILFAVVMCLSLVACGGEETPNTDNSSAQEQQVQNDNNEPEDTTPEYTEIELTTDNFFTYFELTITEEIVENSFGEVSYWYLHYDYALKEEYSTAYLSNGTAVKLNATIGVQAATFDLEKKTYELTGEFSTTTENSGVVREANVAQCKIEIGYADCDILYNRILNLHQNIELLETTGSIFVPIP
ncbi:MAG: hypothetical protein E7618_03520 [Ruminococcaceae bacterium]|nr:hypothetical protein [Oscillospiraceae bacterium]